MSLYAIRGVEHELGRAVVEFRTKDGWLSEDGYRRFTERCRGIVLGHGFERPSFFCDRDVRAELAGLTVTWRVLYKLRGISYGGINRGEVRRS